MKKKENEVKVVKLKLSELKKEFYIRMATDDDTVQLYAEMWEAGSKPPPILVYEKSRIIKDGIHRTEAAELLNYSEIDGILVPDVSPMDMVLDAILSQGRGPLPLTRKDLTHAIEVLLQKGAQRDYIVQRLSLAFPARVITGIFRTISQNVHSRRKREMITKLGENPNKEKIDEVAKEFNVCPIVIQKLIKQKGEIIDNIVFSMNGTLSNLFNTFSRSLAGLLKTLLIKLNDGEVTNAEVKKIFSHLSHCIKRNNQNFTEWEQRYYRILLDLRMDAEKLDELFGSTIEFREEEGQVKVSV